MKRGAAWAIGLLLNAVTAKALDVGATLTGLDAVRHEGRVPAMAVAIFDQGRPVAVQAFGDAAPDTPFRWGSITKSFTGLAALRLVSDGKTSLATPVRDLLGSTYYVNPWADTRPVRLVDLLALTAGLGDLSRTEWNDNTPHPLGEALARHASDRRLHWPAGLQHSYSNVPPGLTAAVIERASGLPFDRYLAERVLVPLGMPDASLAPVPGLPGGFQADGVTEIAYWHMTFAGFGALNASIAEMSRFLAALLNAGRVDDAAGLPAPLIETFFTPAGSLGATAGLEIAYAAGVYGWIRDGHAFWGHGGDADGYRSRYGVLREHGRGYALVINADNPELFARLRRQLERALIADLPDHPRPTLLEAADLHAYGGTYYYPASARFGQAAWRRGEAPRAEIKVARDHLVFRRGDRRTRLYPVGRDRFVRLGDPAVTAVFVRDEAGSLFLQGELGNFVNLSRGPCPDFLASCE